MSSGLDPDLDQCFVGPEMVQTVCKVNKQTTEDYKSRHEQGKR